MTAARQEQPTLTDASMITSDGRAEPAAATDSVVSE